MERGYLIKRGKLLNLQVTRFFDLEARGGT
jgi:hypothetical protein